MFKVHTTRGLQASSFVTSEVTNACDYGNHRGCIDNLGKYAPGKNVTMVVPRLLLLVLGLTCATVPRGSTCPHLWNVDTRTALLPMSFTTTAIWSKSLLTMSVGALSRHMLTKLLRGNAMSC